MGATDRFDIHADHLRFDGEDLKVSRSAHLLGIALLGAEGRIVSYEDLAIIIGSRTGDPANLVKVHVHDLRAGSSGFIPIITHPRKGLSWGPIRDEESRMPSERIIFSHGGIRIDGRDIHLTPLAARMVRYLWLRRDRSHEARDIVKAIGSDSRDPRNILKVSMNTVKRAFAKAGLTSPLRNVRGMGTRWTGSSSLAKHDVAETHADKTGDEKPPGRRGEPG